VVGGGPAGRNDLPLAPSAGPFTMTMNMLTPEQIDQLALEGLCVMAQARDDAAYHYDITGYGRVQRRDTPFGQFRSWDIDWPPAVSLPSCAQCASDQPYLFRLAAFERKQIFTPDEIGGTLRENYVLHSDGPGNGKCEGLIIGRKYGLRMAFELSSWNLALPIAPGQMDLFRAGWERQVLYAKEWCRKLGSAFGVDLVDDPDQLWVVLAGTDLQPLDVFVDGVNKNYEEMNADFRRQYGHDLPLDPRPGPSYTARRIHLWEYIRRRYSEIVRVEAEVVRRHLRGRLVGNVEFDTEVDYPLWGQIYDIPGFNMRVTLFDDEIGYRYWVGYGTRLSGDLTHRAPMISIRTNQVAAGPRIVPTSNATRYWYSQAIQSGAGAFYIWVRDFPGDRRDPHGYAGPCVGNPDPSTRPKERWETHLAMARKLARTRAFRPPPAEAGILVSIPSCVAGGWPSVFSAYIETSLARVVARFVSSVELRESQKPLDGLRLLIVPSAPFEHRAVVENLRKAVEAGLVLVVADPGSLAWDEHGHQNTPGAELLGIRAAEPCSACQTAVLQQDGQSFAYRTYRPGWRLAPAVSADVVGRYGDGAVAAIEHRLGRGKVITLGAPLFDIYAAGIRRLADEDPARRRILRHWCEAAGAATHEWVFDVNVDNVSEVTGSIDVDLPPVDSSIEFAPFMHVHGG